MRSLTLISVCLLLALPYAADATTAEVNSNSSVKVDLSNSSSRLKMVAHLGKRASEAKNAAWTRAQRKGWRVRGEMDGIIFELMAIEDGQPIYNITNNINAAISIATDRIRNTAPYSVDGNGLTIGIWDAGSVLSTHQEFGTRVSVLDGADSHWHSTHVGGTIGAAGVDPAALGMAPGVDIDSYDWDSATSEMTERAASYPEETNKIYLSNHSYGIATGWETGDYSGSDGPHWFGTWGDREAEGFGQYCSLTVTWDSICYSAPYYLPFKSAGNDRTDTAPSEGTTFYYYDGDDWQSKSYNSSTDPYDDGWDNGGFDTIPHRGNSKNIITVGAVSDAVYMGERSLSMAIMLSFSGWGPTDDGRIKPDIVTNGESLYSSTNDSDTSYDTSSGTSMSTSSAAGSATLLTEYYCELFPGQAMRASTLKGLIIHTADDLGNPGPDYSHGWGLMNSKAAADQIKDHNNYPGTNKIVEGLLNATNPNDLYTFIWNGDTAIRATLCWTDPPADALEELDNPSPRLVNDLDLHIINPDSITMYYPFVLDPANPDDPATTGDNTLDNVEQVLIPAPSASGIYTVEVSYKGILTNNEQYYSLIISGQHHLPGPTGIIILDKDTYSCDDLLEIELRDGNLVGNGTQAILVSTDGADSETVTLYEDSYRSGIFTGTIDTESEAVDPEDGMLQVGHGQTITATYYDTNDGTGSPAEANDTATVDCQGPVVVNVQVLDVTSSGAKITFETNEPSSACIRYGLSCEDPNTIIDDPIFATSYSFQLSGLVPETGYYFELAAWDAVGNETVDDNNSVCYQFTTIAVSIGIHVPADYPTIQEAINAANDGDFVIVADGMYTGSGNRDIDFNGKAITVKSENGPGSCIIDCQGSSSSPHRGFRFHNGEGTDSIVSGFTIKNGFGPEAELRSHLGGFDFYPAGGAILCKGSSPTIEDCIFRYNEADKRSSYWGRGGAIACSFSNSIIRNCIFEDNDGYNGGGLYTEKDSVTITGCTFTGNAAADGGGLESWESAVQIENSVINGNSSTGYGGGIYCDDSAATIINCVVNNNTAYDPGPGGASGGGMELECNRGQVIEVINCTIIGNWAENIGGGLSTSCCGNYEVVNSIIWNNLPSQISAYQKTVVTYCNIQGGFSGEGNIDAEPNFVSVSDYHLTEGSACIDAGTNGALSGFPPRDLDGTPRPLDGDADGHDIADMGAFEFWSGPEMPFIAIDKTMISFTAQHSPVSEQKVFSVRNGWAGTFNWQITEDCHWLEVNPTSGVSTGDINEVTVTVDPVGLPTGIYDYQLIISDQNAVNDPQMLLVELHVGYLKVPVEYPTIGQAIDAAFDGDGIIVADGIYTGQDNRNINIQGKRLTVISENGPQNCIIDCQGTGRGFYIYGNDTSGTIIRGFTITNGSAEKGGGIYCERSSPIIENCRITNCSSLGSLPDAGGLYFRYYCDPIIKNCVINSNSGFRGAGIYCWQYCNPQILNCLITDNHANDYGGGVGCASNCSIYTANSTFSNNTALSGGAILNSTNNNVTVVNCILWENLPNQIWVPSTAAVTFSDVQGGYTGQGNIDVDPLFVDPTNNDYHLQWISSCIDAGDPSYASESNEIDIDGEPRVMDGRVDIGADEVSEKQADFNRDGIINLVDLGVFVQSWLSIPGENNWYILCDLYEDSQIDFADYAGFTADYFWQASWYSE